MNSNSCLYWSKIGRLSGSSAVRHESFVAAIYVARTLEQTFKWDVAGAEVKFTEGLKT